LLADSEAFAEVSQRVKADLEALLSGYVIADKSTLRDLNGTLKSLAVLEGDYTTALELVGTIRSLQDKPSDKLTSGLITEAIVAAEQSEGDADGKRKVFRDTYMASVQGLPWDIVQDQIEQTKGGMEIASSNLYVGLVQSQYDPGAVETGKISGDVAQTIVSLRETIDVILPYKEEVISVLGAYIEANRVEKPDIWADRDVALTEGDALSPVVIGIWDSGVDAVVYGSAMFTNPNESANGVDDDANGYVDDVHGIAYGLWGSDPTPEMLYPIDDSARAHLPDVKDEVKGLLDLQAGIDSPEAQDLKKRMAGMQPEEVKPFLENLNMFGNYAHGTHVAGISVAGNPAARVLIVRETFPHELIPPPVTREVAAIWAANMQRTVDYLKANGARVVNMSWGVSAKNLEELLEVNGIGSDADERRKMAAETFDILIKGMTAAMESAPEVLFVPAAGNSDDDVGFTVDMPATIDLPNVLSAGAVDQAGDETSFTSYGETVRIHANGFEVDSYLPGGERMEFSGTSMAAPNVTNLAAKLFALDPELSAEDALRLIVDAAETTEDGRRFLMNPKRSVEMLRQRTGR
ncbi:MAG TPA: S8 family serine peptidase, partial [Rhodothermia bacterium]|nr:S8 family serine peptidase [Rhodothermia bacterium]